MFITRGGEDDGNCLFLQKSSEHILSCPDKNTIRILVAG